MIKEGLEKLVSIPAGGAAAPAAAGAAAPAEEKKEEEKEEEEEEEDVDMSGGGLFGGDDDDWNTQSPARGVFSLVKSYGLFPNKHPINTTLYK